METKGKESATPTITPVFNLDIIDLPEEVTREENELDQVLTSVKIDPSEDLQPPQVALQIYSGSEFVNIGTLGNFSLVIGKAKSRKTFLMTLLIAACVICDILISRIKGCLPKNKSEVLYFDTEQGKYHVQKSVKRICALTGIKVPENLHTYSLRKFHPKARLKLIEHAIYSNNKVGLVIIDGIRDLISSINDEAEGTEITSKLLKWTEDRQIHLICVLHQNKNDQNARGHIGTELVNKAESVLSVTKDEKDKTMSLVEAEYCRDKEPEPFAFEIDLNGIPVEVGNWQARSKITSKKESILDLPDHKKFELLTEVFAVCPDPGYAELWKQLKLAYHNQYKISIGDNKAKDLAGYCKNKRYVTQESSKGPYKLGEYK